MTCVPDVTGLPLDQALKRLAEAGRTGYLIKWTKAPRKDGADESASEDREAYVIRQEEYSLLCAHFRVPTPRRKESE
ncbi:MAG: PASTA domain-containing protein [Clostridia bacterium]|nr:PASTA domain-containing protein [Clostridia bacterium]